MKKILNIFLKSIIIILLITGINQNKVKAQTGQNIDFTSGYYMIWRGYQGQANGTASLVSGWTVYNDPATVYWQGSPCFVINTPTSAAFDPIVPTLRRVPTMWGYTHSSQINNNQANKNCSKLSYDLLITPLNCLLTFNYAMVLQSPSHIGYENPTFRIEVKSLSTSGVEGGLVEPCATFEQTGTNSPMPTGWNTFSSGIWQDWRQVAMNLSAHQGNKVRINIIMTSCESSAHWSYGYFTAKVGYAELTVNACGNGDTIAIIEAPSGFKKYEWISSPTDFTDASTQYAIGPIISQSTATATVTANNKLFIRQTDSFATHQYFAVKLSSPSSGSAPTCESYIKTRVQSMGHVPEFDTIIDCDFKVDFVDQTVLGDAYNPATDTLEYTWDFGDGDTAYYNSFTANNLNRNPSHTYDTASAYYVKLTVKDNDCKNIIIKEIIVPSFPCIILHDTICKGYLYNRNGFHFIADTSGLYRVTGVHLYLTVVTPPTQDIDMVTVDNSNHNVLIWNKKELVDHYNIYREGVIMGQFDLIATVPYNSLGIYSDTNSNPMIKAYMYKISTTDTCINESEKSSYHKTMHLSISQGMGNNWNLNWTPYEGASYTTYNIYRGINSLDSLKYLTTISASNTSYTDINVPAGYVYYQVEILKDTSTSTKSGPIKNIRSNYATNKLVSLDEISKNNENVTLYPNPTSSSIDLEIGQNLVGSNYTIVDQIGKIVLSGKLIQINTNIDLNILPKGLYFLNIEKTRQMLKVIKQ